MNFEYAIAQIEQLISYYDATNDSRSLENLIYELDSVKGVAEKVRDKVEEDKEDTY